MDGVWIVFLAGSMLSFSLMMFLYFKVVRRRGQRSQPNQEPPIAPANKRFLDFLRAEAVSRVTDNIASVLAQQNKSAVSHVRSGSERVASAQLVESRRTLQSLFSSEVVAAYDKVIVALDSGGSSAGDARKYFGEFKIKMKSYLEGHAGVREDVPATG